MFCPGSGSGYYLILDPGSGSNMKSGMRTYFFLASYAFRSKILVLVLVRKIRDLEKKFIPDPD
jgi:hypothetical protein